MRSNSSKPRITPQQKERFNSLRLSGFTQAQAAKESGISKSSAHRLDPGAAALQKYRQAAKGPPDPIPYEELSPEARAAWDDFALFSDRYLAREPVPWRHQAADRLVAALENPDKSYLQLCAPPGVGKTSLVLDLCLWSLVRNRRLRVCLGAETLSRAEDYMRFCKRLLAATTPYYDHIAKREADGVLALDFGRLRPVESEGDEVMWRKEAVIVAQQGDVDLSSKDPSVQIASRDSGFLGSRFDLELWDDLQTLRNFADGSLRQWWMREAETRLEPGGVLVLVGTRAAPEDLFAYNAERHWTDPSEGASQDDSGAELRYEHPLYETITFPAKTEDGMLLDPKRLSAADLAKRATEPHFASVYMQDPTADEGVLIPRIWIDGGSDAEGQLFPGCLDDRLLGQYPEIDAELVSYASIDPGLSTGWTAAELWASPRNLQGPRYLVDAVRAHLRPDELLAIGSEGSLVGLMADWQFASRQRGRPIQVWVIESNLVGSQILSSRAFDFFQFSHPDVAVIAHRTDRNKHAPQVGVEATLPPLARSGSLRLPNAGVEARNVIRAFLGELTSYPHGSTSDLLMAWWFCEANFREILNRAEQPRGSTPILRWGGRYHDLNPPRPEQDTRIYDERGTQVIRRRYRSFANWETPEVTEGWR